MASDNPRLWGQRPYPSTLETEGEYPSLDLEGEGRSWGGGRGASWRPHEWDERGGPQSPPSMEDRDFYLVSDMAGRRRSWLSPREQEEEGGWGPTNRGPQETPRKYQSPKMMGRRGSCEPPRKRVRVPSVGEWLRDPLSPPREDSWESPQKMVQSPPMDEWWRVPLSPPRGRGSTSPDYQRQPSTSSSHATHQEPSSRSSQRDSPSKAGSLWVTRGGWDSPAVESRGRSRELPEPSWESCRDPEMSRLANRRAIEGRDSNKSRWRKERGGGGSSSSSSHHRSRTDPEWETRHGNSMDGSRESWSRRGVQSFQSQIDSRERDNQGLKGRQDEGWARDKGLSREDQGRSLRSPRESIPTKGQGAKERIRGNFLGPRGGPERYEGPGKQAATTGTFFPRLEVVNYWMRCHHVMLKNARDKFLSFCPRPYIPDRSSIPPTENSDLKQLIGKHAKSPYNNVRFLLQTQWDVLTMLGPAMAVYEMAEAAIERQEGVDPLAVRPLVRSLLSFAGSANRKLTLQRCSQVFQAIDPQLGPMVTKISNPNSGTRLFAEHDVDVLKEVIHNLETLPEESPESNSDNHREAGRHTLMASPWKSALLPETNSDQQIQLQDQASLELWHRRFGHANSNTILRLQRDKLVIGIKVDPGEGNSTARCVTCLTEWDPKPPFPLNTVRSSTTLMDLVHCELSGPFNVPSLMLQRYVLIFVEDFSRFCVTYLLKEMGEVHECFEKYLNLLRTREKRQKSRPKAFQLNSVADAVSPQTLSFLEAQGIAHKRGVESIPRKSRTAEKEMKSLLEMTRCMLADAMLPEPFWGHAILAATYLQNRLPFKSKKRTRFQAWYGKVPNVKHLRVFGSLVLNRQEPAGDVQHIFVGYSSYKSGYQFMNLETGVILRRHTQDFNEGKGVKKRGKFLEAVERHSCDIEALAGIVMSMMPQPEKYTMLAAGETREETIMPADGSGDEED